MALREAFEQGRPHDGDRIVSPPSAEASFGRAMVVEWTPVGPDPRRRGRARRYRRQLDYAMPIELPQGPCIFCERISAGTHPERWATIDEDEHTVGVINPRQYEEGQAMVLPKRHAPTVLDLTDDEAGALMLAVRRIAQAMVAAFDPDGITLFQNNGVASYQQVPHVHARRAAPLRRRLGRRPALSGRPDARRPDKRFEERPCQRTGWMRWRSASGRSSTP